MRLLRLLALSVQLSALILALLVPASAQQTTALVDATTGEMKRPAPALLRTANDLAQASTTPSTTTLNGYFADPSTNASFAAAAWRTDLALVPGTNVQAWDADLDAWALVNPSSYSTTAQIAAAYQPLDADLTSWAAVTRAAGFDTFVATPSGANLASLLITALPASKGGTGLTALSANVVTLLGAADYAAMRTQLALVPGTNVQAYDADLSSIAANTTGGFLTRTAADTYTARTLTGTAGQITVTNGDGVAGNPTISLPSTITQATTFSAAAVFGSTVDQERADTTTSSNHWFKTGSNRIWGIGQRAGDSLFHIYDGVNSQSRITVSASNASGIVAFNGTLPATSTTAASATFGGGIGVAGAGYFGGPVVFKNYTVATLPAASSYTYGIVYVSDATNAAGTGAGTAPTGGGSVRRAVYSDGASWLLL